MDRSCSFTASTNRSILDNLRDAARLVHLVVALDSDFDRIRLWQAAMSDEKWPSYSKEDADGATVSRVAASVLLV